MEDKTEHLLSDDTNSGLEFPAENRDISKETAQLMAVSFYAAVIMTVISCGSVAIYKIGQTPSRYHFWFHSDRTRKHAIAGCLLMFGFFMPAATRGMFDPSTIIFGTLFYAFVLVPLVSGLIDPKPLQELSSSFFIWLIQTFIAIISISLFSFLLLIKWGPTFYFNNPKIQKVLKQILFFYLCKNWICPSEENSYLHLQIFGFFKFLESAKSLLQENFKLHIAEDLSSSLFLNPSPVRFFVWVTSLLVSFYLYLPEMKPGFLLLSIAYHFLTQIEIVPNSEESHHIIRFLKSFHIRHLAELEFLLVPFFVELIPILLSVWLVIGEASRLIAITSIFVNIVHPWIILKNTWLHCLQLELGYLRHYTLADEEDIKKLETEDLDGSESSCPICLDQMFVCRKTPCGHLFHWSCFRRCHRLAQRCPICRTELQL